MDIISRMGKQTYYKVVSVVFLMIALLHFLRGIFKWEAIIGSAAIPVWFSWVAVVIAVYLGIRGLQLAKE